MKTDVAIIGAGPAGLAAALACWEQGVKNILLLERDKELGGILQQCIHNGFGLHFFGEELTGPEYAQRFIDQLAATGVIIKTETMVLGVSADRVLTAVNTRDGLMTIEAGAIILAMGCRERTRGALGICGSRPSGVFTAGCAQRLVNMEGYMPGRDVVILGSGDIGLIMARRMIWEGARVRMVCELMPYSSGLTRNIVQCLEDNGIPMRLNHTVVEIHGRPRLTGVTVAQVDEHRRPIPETFEYVPCDTLLLSVGLIPENELTQMAEIELDGITRGATVNQYRETKVPGIFACGNVLHVHDLVDHVSREAVLAGQGAARYIKTGEDKRVEILIHPAGAARYTVPQRLRVGPGAEDVDLYFRVGESVRPAVVEVCSGGRVLLRRKKPVMLPGEMEQVTLKAGDLAGLSEAITVTVTHEEAKS